MFNSFFKLIPSLAIVLLLFTLISPIQAQKKKKTAKIKVLLIDGQSKNHSNWKEWTPILLRQLDDSGLFRVDISTSPMKGESLDKFNPKFKNRVRIDINEFQKSYLLLKDKNQLTLK